MKIGVISDTHIPDRAKEIPRKILEAFKEVNMVVHAGDLVEVRVLEELKTVCRNVKAVWGNMDHYEVKKELPEKEIFAVGNYKIGIMHGYGHPNKLIDLMSEVFKKDNLDLIILLFKAFPVNYLLGKDCSIYLILMVFY